MTPRAGKAGAVGPPPLWLIVSITLTGIMANVLLTPATPEIVDDFGVSRSAIGLLLAITTAPGIILAPVAGVLSDRYGRREVVVPCLVLFGFSGGLAMFAPTFGALLVLRFLQGVGTAGLVNLAVVIIGDHWDGAERAKRVGRNAAALTTSVVVLPPIGGLLSAVGGWRLTFAPYWLALGTAVLIARRLPRSRSSGVTIGEQLRAAGPLVRSRIVWGPMVVGFVLFVLIFGLFLTVIPIHLDEAFGLGEAQRGLLIGLPAITSTASALSAGRVRERFRPGGVAIAAWGALAAGFLCIGLADVLPVLALGALVYGLGEGLLIPTLQDSLLGAAPPASRGAVMAAFTATVRAGQTAGPLLFAASLDLFGASTSFVIGAGIAAALAFLRPLLLPSVPSHGLPTQRQVIAAPDPKSVP